MIFCFECSSIEDYKMNDIVNNFLLVGDKFMPKMHLKQAEFTYSTCGPLTKNKERIQKFKETVNTKYIYKKYLHKASFPYDMAYGDFKDLATRTASDKVSRDKALNIAKSPKHDGNQRDLNSMVYKYFDKKFSCSGIAVLQNERPSDLAIQLLAEELHKPIIKKSKRRKVYSSFKGSIWGADLADMQLKSKFNKRIRFLLCVIDLFSKYAWVVPLKDKIRYYYC